MDNTVAISYINQKGGTHSTKLYQLALDLWSWCIDRNITVHAEHLPGKLNVIADYESRHQQQLAVGQGNFLSSPTDSWSFLSESFCVVQECTLSTGGVLHSWKADLQATAIDAFVQDWSSHRPYLSPPFVLIGRCLQKIRKDNVHLALIIALTWPAQTWYPLTFSF